MEWIIEVLMMTGIAILKATGFIMLLVATYVVGRLVADKLFGRRG